MESKKGHRSVLLVGTIACALSLFIFAITDFFFRFHNVDFALLLLALLLLGIAFGAIVTILTPYMLVLFPKHTHAATVAVFGIVCLGATCSPLIFHNLAKIGLWWLHPVISGSILVVLVLLSFLILPNHKQEAALFPEKQSQTIDHTRLPFLFWGFFSMMLLYGVLMTVFANWSTIYLHRENHFSTAVASTALSLYWGMMLVGRAVIVGGSSWIPSRGAYIVMPILIILSFVLIPFVHSASGNLGLFAFAGLAFSATFPFNFSFAAQTFPARAATVSGRITAAYMIGFGITAYGVGFLYDILGIPLQHIFFYGWTLSLVMLILAIVLMRHKKVVG